MNKKFEHICSFERKLQLFQIQLGKTSLAHFPCLETRKAEILYINCVKLCAGFTNQFADFRKCEMEFKLFSQPFEIAAEDSPDCYQMELIDLQSDMDLKRAYGDNNLVNFYKNYVTNLGVFQTQRQKKSLVLVAHIVVNSFSQKKKNSLKANAKVRYDLLPHLSELTLTNCAKTWYQLSH